MTDDILRSYDQMSPSQKKIADFITENDEMAAFMTAAKLGKAAGVSEATVVRFAAMLGYEKYSEFQQSMVDEIQSRLVSDKKSTTNKLKADPSGLMKKVLVHDAQNIVDSIHLVPDAVFDMAVDLLDDAAHIYVLGIRNCAPLADLLTYYLSVIRPDVKALTSNNISELYEQMNWIGKGDVLVAMSFPRYSLRTLKAMDFANSQGARLISITDSEYSPMNMYSSCNLWAKTDMITLADSLVAPMSVINALIVALYLRNEKKIIENPTRLEDLWKDFQTYDKDELGDPGE